jgi:hypothetical protein
VVDSPGIAVTQEPDPAVTRGDQVAVLHLAITNIGHDRLRIDRITTWPSWLLYPGVFQALWIEPGATQRMGLTIIPANLPGGDYKAQVTFLTSTTTQTMVGAKPLWRDLRCDVRVRVVRSFAPLGGQPPATGAGCATLIFGALAACLGLVAAAVAAVVR